ncbi:MAG: cytochrome c oxidase subunit II [Candidatus Limnocylindria bacterium]
MATSPRAGRSSAALTALIIGAVLLGLVAAAALLGGDPLGLPQRFVDSLYPPEAVTSQGAAIRELYTIVFLIAVAIFFVVEGLIIWTVVRYRRRPTDDALPPQTHGNAIAEVVWTVVPTIIVAFLFVVSWQTLNTVEAVSAEPDMKVRAVAGQFQWTFEYLPDDWEPTDQPRKDPVYTEFVPTRTGDIGGLVLPTGRSIKLYLDSPDVIHAFYVPQFLFKRDVVPGRTNVFEFDIKDTDAGQTFRGQCAELCGAGHRSMLFDVVALSGAEFDAWFEDKVANAPEPPPSGEPTPTDGGPGPAPVPISALDLAFEQTELSAPADTPFPMAFDNKDPGIPHNVEIKDGSGASVFVGDIFPGPEVRTYQIPALAAGSYPFLCTVHPNMTGTLTVN